jgi:hypothetical protein
MCYFCIADLNIADNNIKPQSDAMEIQKCIPFALLSSCKIFHTAVHKMNILVSPCQVPDTVV